MKLGMSLDSTKSIHVVMSWDVLSAVVRGMFYNIVFVLKEKEPFPKDVLGDCPSLYPPIYLYLYLSASIYVYIYIYTVSISIYMYLNSSISI